MEPPDQLTKSESKVAADTSAQGTAASAEAELFEMYKLRVETVPPHRPSVRVDHPVECYTDAQLSAKFIRLVHLLEQSAVRRQPVLVCTDSVEESEVLNRMLLQA